MAQSVSRPVRRTVAAFAGAAAVALLVGGCGGSTPSDSSTTTPATTSTAATAPASAQASDGVLSISDTWVKATGGADPSMTAAFGVLNNDGDAPLTITAARTSASGTTELHEMAMDNGAMVMRPVAGGIVVPAHGTATLEPGGLHVMIMDVTRPIQPGDEITVDLTVDDGSTLTFTALAKEFAGAQESYSPSADMSGMSMAPMSSAPAGG